MVRERQGTGWKRVWEEFRGDGILNVLATFDGVM